jgi:hypothetical protein
LKEADCKKKCEEDADCFMYMVNINNKRCYFGKPGNNNKATVSCKTTPSFIFAGEMKTSAGQKVWNLKNKVLNE